MKIHIAHSPDSDDAFMFYGLASGKVTADGFELEHVLSDIETLNRAAFDGAYEITAVSFHAYAHLTDRYILLPHGASMGDRYGPIVVSKRAVSSLKGVTVAIPGTLTTAFLTLRLFDPSVQYVVMPFDRIQEVGRRRAEEDRRPRRMVGRSHGRPAAAARRQCDSEGPWGRNDCHAVAAVARQHCLRPGAS